MRLLSIITAAYLVIATALAAWVYFDALETALQNDRAAGKVRLSEATGRLRSQLDIFKALVNIVAKDPKFANALKSKNPDAVSSDLAVLQLTYGAWEIDLVGADRRVVASSSPGHVGYVYSPNLIRSAINGRLGYAVELDEKERLARFSRGVLRNSGAISGAPSGPQPIGAVIVSANLAALEFEWPVTPEPIVFFDRNGISLSANRPDLVLRSLEEAKSNTPLFPLRPAATVGSTQLYTFQAGDGSETEVQILEASVPQLQMTARILLDTEEARDFAFLRMGLALALMVALALVGAVFVQQRRRLALESRTSAILEQSVEARTAELRAAQDKLMEASNLAALGRLSAGVSHELNQPLGAILNFAENGKRFIEKARPEQASKNLGQIADQVRRITRIITNLRAFARQEPTLTERINFCDVVSSAIKLAKDDIQQAQVTLAFTVPDNAVYVTAGKVRLEQVVLNLISNALDAMQTSKDKKLTLSLTEQGSQVALSIRDTGMGIEDPARVFEPFYTTKELGSSKGLGMGLALSFGLVAHFGGQLSCRNLPVGAEFVLSLPKAASIDQSGPRLEAKTGAVA